MRISFGTRLRYLVPVVKRGVTPISKWRIMPHGNYSYGNGPFQYDRTVALDPRFTDAYCKRGLTGLRQGEEAAAQRNFNWLLPRLRPFRNRSAVTFQSGDGGCKQYHAAIFRNEHADRSKRRYDGKWRPSLTATSGYL